MLKPQVNHHTQSTKTLFPLEKPFLFGNGGQSFLLQVQSRPSSSNKAPKVRVGFSSNIKAISIPFTGRNNTFTKVKAVVTVKRTIGSLISDLTLTPGDIKELLGRSLQLELISAELDPKTGLEKATVKDFADRGLFPNDGFDITYRAEFKVPLDFGEVGAIYVKNDHDFEFFLKDVVLEGFPNGPIKITCDSWIQPKFVEEKRVFFTYKSFLPSKTPNGLERLRGEELIKLRGNGQGLRQASDRIYDYDVYNDLGSPDSKQDLARPVLGGKQHPYPRRCRTGRDPYPKSETRVRDNLTFYVPRDESFSGIKTATFGAKALYTLLHSLIPTLTSVIIDRDRGFPYFTEIDKLFNEGVNLPKKDKKSLINAIPRLVKGVKDTAENILKFETPDAMDRDKFFWFRDEEFARQTLAGLNPYTLRLVTEWPLKSTLDPKIYGPPESEITKEIIEHEIRGFMTLDEALEQKKLFMLDYHDLLLPYVEKVRQLEDTSFYASRTLFFLNPDGTLRPIAIELTRPPMDGKPQWKRVYTPSWHSTECWLWKIAKAHVLAHDSGYHQLVSHWLRTHCCTEPYIIATNRQLSAMHPIYRLLNPHFRYTMEINALARLALINADGVIESTFSPGKESIELSSFAYDKQWRFDNEALPKDLISRQEFSDPIQKGLAVEDPSAPHGLKLTIEDNPFATDGLVLWDIIKQWVTDYVNHYYPDPSLVESDKELQAWWFEIRNVGHADKKDEPWWPVLKTSEDLIEIITTIVWVTSGHHAAVNFGQYTYGGYFPNRPTITRTHMPDEDPTEETWKFFMEKPEAVLLEALPSQIQATKVMAVLDTLSTHSPEEEYLGDIVEPSWKQDPVINAAFERFNGKLKEFEGIVDGRNANTNLKNRNGAGMMPYELLKPFSKPGVTGKGVPYSISI
ncbi:hypothetical protein LWI28_025165 [Acer negundo]|uniref:Lipoxygenase n=1 Tax=Acer negundo TaxID=4023 RepID=A0AAD5P1Y3_ACENE|nr:hypothetical protein LWI28_025165 [Acer negundo]KAK4855208.1 hypothetical protein QYF36_005025 [Acer negundo]